MVSTPLNSLRFFESVARLGSLSAAAIELHVTVGAVSQQLKALQDSLGTELFHKRGRSLYLTDQGRAFHKRISHALDEVSAAVGEVKSERGNLPARSNLTISIPPAEGVTWLVKPLFELMESSSSMTLTIRTANFFNQVDWRNVDVAVVYGTPPWSGFWWCLLHGINLTPVCSPKFLRGKQAIHSVTDLSKHRLLHEDDGSQWQQWLTDAGSKQVRTGDVYLEDFGLALQAARDGFGVALSDEKVSARDLDEGRLVQPLALLSPAVHNYYCVCVESKRKQPEVEAFIEWLMAIKE